MSTPLRYHDWYLARERRRPQCPCCDCQEVDRCTDGCSCPCDLPDGSHDEG